MQTNLDALIKPSSVAVIGASNQVGHPGNTVMRNLLASKFLGPVMPVNETREPVLDQESYRDIDTLPLTPDLAILCAEPETLPQYVAELGHRGTRAAILLSRGMFRYQDENHPLRKRLAQAAKESGMRFLGPNCLGLINPVVGLNASLAHRDALPGRIAFVSQSDALFTTILDWASSKGIGFSHFISLGDRFDIRFDHILDYLNADFNTRAVLLYVETIIHARRFMSAARALARNKPLLILKAGTSVEGARAAAAHSGAYLGEDDVYDAAFRRAGALRVFDIDSLFDAVETLARGQTPRGERLAIVTNGGGPGFLATDSLVALGGRLAKLSAETLAELETTLPEQWSYPNPLVLRSNAEPDLYGQTLRVLLQDRDVDGILIMHVPTATISSEEVAQSVIGAGKKSKRPILTSWLGIDDAQASRDAFAKAGISTFFTPENAIRAFVNLVQYRRNQDMLMEAPASLPEDFVPDVTRAKEVIQRAIKEQRQVLTEPESVEILASYDIPVLPVQRAASVEEAVIAAEELGFPVALKIQSPDLERKSLAGGVDLDLNTAEAVHAAAEAMLDRVHRLSPDARLEGFLVQRMGRRAGAHEVLIETGTDPVFGPVIRFGQGGSLQEIIQDREVALPPLNLHLARELISRTRIHQLLLGSRGRTGADLGAIELTLVKISQMLIDLPEIFEMEINPLFADENGVLALDAQMRVAATHATGPEQLAIRPYPRELEECALLRDKRQIHIRPIRPEDEPDHWDFIDHMSPEDRRYRFFGNVGDLPRSEMTRLTQIDYDREMAFIARGPDNEGRIKTLGVVRAMTSPDNATAEFAVVVRSDMKRLGLGAILMSKIIRYCRDRGTNRIVGQALADNRGMKELAEHVGFEVKKNYEEDVWDFRLFLNPS